MKGDAEGDMDIDQARASLARYVDERLKYNHGITSAMIAVSDILVRVRAWALIWKKAAKKNRAWARRVSRVLVVIEGEKQYALRKLAEVNTKTYRLAKVVEALAELIWDWNKLKDDGDSGPGNDALVLVIHDDGSGYLGTAFGKLNDVNHQCDFGECAELVKYLEAWTE